MGHEALTFTARLRVLKAVEDCSNVDLKEYLLKSIEPKLSADIKASFASFRGIAGFQPGSSNEGFSKYNLSSELQHLSPKADIIRANSRESPDVSQEVCLIPTSSAYHTSCISVTNALIYTGELNDPATRNVLDINSISGGAVSFPKKLFTVNIKPATQQMEQVMENQAIAKVVNNPANYRESPKVS